jgi:hypothetical protein
MVTNEFTHMFDKYVLVICQMLCQPYGYMTVAN